MARIWRRRGPRPASRRIMSFTACLKGSTSSLPHAFQRRNRSMRRRTTGWPEAAPRRRQRGRRGHPPQKSFRHHEGNAKAPVVMREGPLRPPDKAAPRGSSDDEKNQRPIGRKRLRPAGHSVLQPAGRHQISQPVDDRAEMAPDHASTRKRTARQKKSGRSQGERVCAAILPTLHCNVAKCQAAGRVSAPYLRA